MTAAAKAEGVSATITFWPGVAFKPSTPSVVDTTGTPAAMASSAFRRVPLANPGRNDGHSGAAIQRPDVFDRAGNADAGFAPQRDDFRNGPGTGNHKSKLRPGLADDLPNLARAVKLRIDVGVIINLTDKQYG